MYVQLLNRYQPEKFTFDLHFISKQYIKLDNTKDQILQYIWKNQVRN